MLPLCDDNPSVRPPLVAVGLIEANALVFLYQSSLPPQLERSRVQSFGRLPPGGGVRAKPSPRAVALAVWAGQR